jgi:glucosamine--fructose-6-phosphate aminotransferase (isomerizing)
MTIISQMEKEALTAPELIGKQFAANQLLLADLAKRLQREPPIAAMTIARGSSDHAATFAKYLLEARAGIMTASAAPSVLTLYGRKLSLAKMLVMGLSQSGASPDITETMVAARDSGAITLAFVNDPDSPLARAAEYVIPLGAGVEKAVAATKSYLTTLSALVQLVAMITQDAPLLLALIKLPEILARAADVDWSEAIELYTPVQNTYVIGRGFGYPVAQEAALKFKETAKIHAEAFSSAEVLHGPFALVEKNFPVLMLAQQDESLPGMRVIAQRMQKLGANILFASPQHLNNSLDLSTGITRLAMPAGLHPVCDPLLMIQAVYMMMARLSLARGFNPDAPTNLTKVTKTW